MNPNEDSSDEDCDPKLAAAISLAVKNFQTSRASKDDDSHLGAVGGQASITHKDVVSNEGNVVNPRTGKSYFPSSKGFYPAGKEKYIPVPTFPAKEDVPLSVILKRRGERHDTKFWHEGVGRTRNPPPKSLKNEFVYERCPLPLNPYPFIPEDVLDYAGDKYELEKDRYCWKVTKFHPLRLPGCPSGATYLEPLDWPYVLDRGGMLLYQFYRTRFCVAQVNIVSMEVYNMDTKRTVVCWVPKSCGPFTTFHSQVEICVIDVNMLAKAFGINVLRGMSKGLETFLYGLVFGRHQIQELYIGKCLKCQFVFCHLDGHHTTCFVCQDCGVKFHSQKDRKAHQEQEKHYDY